MSRPGAFGYITMPGSRQELTSRIKLPGTRWLPAFLIDSISSLLSPASSRDAFCFVADSGKSAVCDVVSLPIIPGRMGYVPQHSFSKKLNQAIDIASQNGVDIVGLSPIVAWYSGISLPGGQWQEKLCVTTGLVYSVAASAEAIGLTMLSRGQELNSCGLLIVGADAPHGTALARILAPKLGGLSLWGQNYAQVDRLSMQILHESGIAAKVMPNISNGLSKADIVVFAHSLGEPVHMAEFSEKAVVYPFSGLSFPHSLLLTGKPSSRQVVLEGPDIRFSGNDNQDNIHPHMVEPATLALTGKRRSMGVGGKVSIEEVLEVSRDAEAVGFRVVGYREGGNSVAV